MESNINKFSTSASHILKQKAVLDKATYVQKMEALLSEIAHESAENSLLPYQHPDILEKMSFEIRTPMNSILGFTGLLKDSYFTTEEKDEFIDLIERNTEQLIDLLNDLTELTKIENLQINLRMEKFELNVFLLNIITDFKNNSVGSVLSIFKTIAPNLPQDICIYTDPYQLHKIITNLLNNVNQFDKNEKVELFAEVVDDHLLRIKIISSLMELPESISRSIKRHINIQKGQNAFDGTGLKLTVTKALVDLLNGFIEFKQLKPKGSEFVVEIPIRVCSLQ
jgi:signal transduction histidine kinase